MKPTVPCGTLCQQTLEESRAALPQGITDFIERVRQQPTPRAS